MQILSRRTKNNPALIGEPGVGKTRLVHEMLASAQLEGARALAGGCYENEATTPYLPFLEAFRRVVRDTPDEPLRVASFYAAQWNGAGYHVTEDISPQGGVVAVGKGTTV